MSEMLVETKEAIGVTHPSSSILERSINRLGMFGRIGYQDLGGCHSASGLH